MAENTERVLVTCAAEVEAVAWAELKALFPAVSPPDWLDSGDAIEGGILLADPGVSFDAFAAEVARRGPIFIRHIAPVQCEVALQGSEADMAAFCAAATELAPRLDPARTFAVQSRILGEGRLPYRKVVLNETLSGQLEVLTGAVMDCRAPEQVLSVTCTPTTGYLGVSWTRQNRSAWPGGKHRFKKEAGQVSRAEFKLLEAISVFGLTLPTEGAALDMGASPGGWARVLQGHGLRVFAVDPADLDDRLRGVAGITHVRRRVQDFLPGAPWFDVIVNDMKMDARPSVEIMAQASRHLNAGGIGLMTLKMPQMVRSAKAARETLAMVHKDIGRLSEHYQILGARQLYHNRNEVTVALGARAEPF